jgi:hypothetical protein
MIDYWEAIGRLASNAQLNNQFQNMAACTKPRKAALVYGKDGSVAGNGLDIAKTDFDEVQGFIGKVLTEKTLSLIGAGELMWDFSFPQSRSAMVDVNGVIAGKVTGLGTPSTAYFIALGKVIVDATLRAAVTKPGANLAAAFPRLSAVEIAAIALLLETAAFLKAVEEFGEFPWEPGCIGGSDFTAGYIQPKGIWAKKKAGRLVTNPGGTWGAAATAGYAHK